MTDCGQLLMFLRSTVILRGLPHLGKETAGQWNRRARWALNFGIEKFAKIF